MVLRQSRKRPPCQVVVRRGPCRIRFLHGQNDHGEKDDEATGIDLLPVSWRCNSRGGGGYSGAAAAGAAVGGAIAAVTSDDPRLLKITTFWMKRCGLH